MARPPAQLLVYRFGPDAGFEGRLLGALERFEGGGALRVLDALFVTRDGDTGEIVAIDLQRVGAGGIAAPLLSFRLDSSARREATERALASSAGDTVRELANGLEHGDAIAAVLLEHVWARTLDDAVSRTGGTELANDFVDAAALADLTPEVLTAAGHPPPFSSH